jgi:formylglycine-generating enzyme required for sulfatase activity
VVNLYAVWKAALYMVIDLSSGVNSSKYPVSYLDAVPSGGWSDTYKTTKLVLRRIEMGSFKMCGQYNVTLTKPFYIGVFEMTQKQCALITGRIHSFYEGNLRPVDNISWDEVRGSSDKYNWPQIAAISSDSVMGRLSSRTGVSFDLPTEAQWEYACRAGTTSKYNNGGNSEEDLRLVGRYYGNNDRWHGDGLGGYYEHTKVGMYMSNSWGLYDMHGNVSEWCLDWYGSLEDNVVDPQGPTSHYDGGRVVRGGGYGHNAVGCTSSWREYSRVYFEEGFRVCINFK